MKEFIFQKPIYPIDKSKYTTYNECIKRKNMNHQRKGNMMKYGDTFETNLVDIWSKKRFPVSRVYRRVEYHGWHTDDEGYGLWRDDKQILGTCQFDVAGCKLESSAKAKLRKFVREYEN